MANFKKSSVVVSTIFAIGICYSACTFSRAEVSGSLPPELQDIVKLSQAQVPDDVIVAHIKNSGVPYHMTADEIIYLRGEGVSKEVISTLVQVEAPSAPPTPSAAAPPQPPVQSGPAQSGPAQSGPAQNGPPSQSAVSVAAPAGDAPPEPAAGPTINFDYFHDQLAPYGTWINVGGVMYWRPDRAIAANPDWRPYYDNGQWTHTDNGLFWQSDYSWGDIPFHYGRWVLDPVNGWLWAPDYTWGPAWVFWRQAEADSAIGWAPLPYGATFVDGGFLYNGVVVAADYDFGYPEDHWTFIGYDHFHEDYFRLRGREYAYHYNRVQIHNFYSRTVIRNDFHRDAQGRFVNEGIGKDRVAKLTKVQDSKFEERNAVGDRNKLAADRAAHAEADKSAVAKAGDKAADKPGDKPGDRAGDRAGASAGAKNATPANARPGGSSETGRTGAAAPSVSKVFRPPAQPAAQPAAAPAQRSSGGGGGGGGGRGKK